MMDWPVGLSTGCFYRTSIFQCLEHIRNSGFTMLEICSSPSHLDYHDQDAIKRAAGMIDDFGMEAYSFHAPFAKDIDVSSLDKQQRSDSRDEIMRAADAAAQLGVRHFVFHPGPEAERHAAEAELVNRMNNAAEAINAISDYCGRRNIAIALENMLPHMHFGNARDMLWILGTVDNVTPGVCLDTGHGYLAGELYSMAFKFAGHLRMIHANDNMGKHDDHIPPGKGLIDWPKLLHELWETEFRGALILELNGESGIPAQQMLSGARTSMQYLRRESAKLFLEMVLNSEQQAHPA